MTTVAKIVMTLLAVGTFIYSIALLDSRQFITGFGCLIGTSVIAFIVNRIQE